jgi:hypothetical protein
MKFVIILLCCLCVASSKSHISHKDKLIVKDGRLEGLADLLNSHESHQLFNNWQGTVNNSLAFLRMLEPWLLHENPVDITSSLPATETDVNCKNIAFSQSLTGYPLAHQNQRLIVDFVPFGYDVDKLLVRFHETARYVDVFVVYEMPYTLLGHPKPLFFERIKHQARFKKFIDKVIYVNPDMDGLQQAIVETKQAIDRYIEKHKYERKSSDRNGLELGSLGQQGSSSYLEPALYSVMKFFNRDLVIQFNKIGSFTPNTEQEIKNNDLKKILFDKVNSNGVKSVYAIQNDGDEFVKGEVLRHIRHCELKNDVESIYTPCFGFKNNYNWLQTTIDMRGFTSGQETKFGIVDVIKYLKTANFGYFFGKGLQMELNQFMWRLGPHLWPLKTIVDSGQMQRRNFTTDRFFNHHMGYGAATHMSAVNDPVELWYKACGTVEMIDVCAGNMVPKSIRDAAIRKAVTPKMIYDNTIFPWCHGVNKAINVQTLSKRARKIVTNSIPWVVKNNPSVFPFMLPVKGLSTTGLFEKAANVDWTKVCPYEKKGIVDT